MATQGKREALIQAAAALFHERGIAATSIADIAKRAAVPVGNVYYYFKTKEELGMAAAVQRRKESDDFCAYLDTKYADPMQRLQRAAGFFAEASKEYVASGCPIAQMCQTGDIATDPIASAYADIYKAYLQWVEKQFRNVGLIQDADALAQQFLSRLQGAALVAKTLQNRALLEREAHEVQQWLRGFEAKAAA